MITAKAKIKVHDDYESLVPILIPELEDVRRFASELHARGVAWAGELFGWPAEYHPERVESPLDSKLSFTPADFCIGENSIWFFSLMWEHGKDAPPAEYLDDSHILAEATAK
ncbi:MAG: hypothetical protein ABFC77_08280 [Thermoguttaceae bacterium]